MTIGPLPQLPLVCLKSADFLDTQKVVKGKNTIIDFWTTKCTRCPAALDKLDNMAQDPKYENVQFVSICCDKLDGARNIIEQEEQERWQNVSHYFMEEKDKEQAKKLLGFRQVPFYVVLDEFGEIQQMGNHRAIDFDEVPGVVRPEPSESSLSEEEKMEPQVELGFDDMDFSLDFANRLSFTGDEPVHPPSVQVERVFEMDDDF